jgi:predicted amidohydrolase YtcJ
MDRGREIEAFAVSAGRISAVGTGDDIRGCRPQRPGHRRADQRRPGFIDAHCHPDGVEGWWV